MGLDVGDVESVLNERTKAVVQVPLWGYPVPMDDLTSLCESKGVALIEDIAQAHGTTWRGRNLGSFGTLGCMSTHERKLIATGEGGAVLTDDPALAGKVRTLRRYGIAPEGIGKVVGLNFKLPAVSAALGRTQVAKLSEKIASRNRVASEIRQVVSGVAWLQEIPVDEASIANYYGFVAACDESINVKDFEQHLASKGVISDTWRYGYKPLYEYPLLQDSVRACPNAEEFIRRVVTLPSHEGMTPADVSQVAEALNSYAA
jgi:dTDP-4-amino-4,6-dideoxygalactose transaminase